MKLTIRSHKMSLTMCNMKIRKIQNHNCSKKKRGAVKNNKSDLK